MPKRADRRGDDVDLEELEEKFDRSRLNSVSVTAFAHQHGQCIDYYTSTCDSQYTVTPHYGCPETVPLVSASLIYNCLLGV
jgi:hypothetical protein